MASIATVAELTNYLRKGVDTDSAQRALDIATGWIVDDLDQLLFPGTLTDEIVYGGYPTLYLPQAPVNAITTVKTVESGVTTVRVENTDWVRRGMRGLKWIGSGVWPDVVQVTWDYGYSAFPEGLKGTCLVVAARLYDNPKMLRSFVLGGRQGTYMAVGAGLTEDEAASLDKYRLMVV